MNFSQKTIDILTNFSSINTSIVFKPGKRISTAANLGGILAFADIDTEITDTFGIYNLPQFLALVSTMNNPEYTVNGKHLDIKGMTNGKPRRAEIPIAEPRLIKQAPDGLAKLPPALVEITLTEEDLKDVLKSASILNLPEIAFVGNREKIYLSAFNTKNSSDATYEVEIGETTAEFKIMFDIKDVIVIPDSYNIKICEKITEFKSDSVTYYIAVNSSSSYTE